MSLQCLILISDNPFNLKISDRDRMVSKTDVRVKHDIYLPNWVFVSVLP